MIPKTKEDITVTLADGRVITWEKGDFSRFAPGAVCNIASKIVSLRKILKDHGEEIPANIRKKLEVISAPFSFEDCFLSSDIVKVHEGIEELGHNEIQRQTA